MKHIVTILLVIGIAGVGYALFTQTGENTTFYYEVDQVDHAVIGTDRVKISGVVAEDSVNKLPELKTTFSVHGESTDTESIPVAYTGPLPDIFRDGIQVVVTGSFNENNEFIADELLAKCPSKYQAEGNREDFEHLDGYEIEYDHRKLKGADGDS